ncbi:hypothetical protein IPH92_00445 [Candidatus Kaiserbacteria bacterium]|nr:MAG: hypothetical protein IPH92_00445 [Candidatus Kaiserbacteria bacterium]
MKNYTSQKGFIALMSITILSIMFFVTTLSLAQFGIASRFFMLELENKSASEHLAEACVHIARIATYNNPLADISNRIIPVGEESCTILSITPQNNESIVDATANRGSAQTTYRVVIHNANGDFVSWTEL